MESSQPCHGWLRQKIFPIILARHGMVHGTCQRQWIFLPRIQKYGVRQFSFSATMKMTDTMIMSLRLLHRYLIGREPDLFQQTLISEPNTFHWTRICNASLRSKRGVDPSVLAIGFRW